MERSKHYTIILKKGSRNKSENYRPVSLTSVICKLLERLIKYHLVDFLVKNKLINPSQHGFLKARSCLTNMLCFLEDVTKWVDEESQNCLGKLKVMQIDSIYKMFLIS